MNKFNNKIPKINCSNDREMVQESLRQPKAQPINKTEKKPKELRQFYKKLAKQQFLENRVMLKYSV